MALVEGRMVINQQTLLENLGCKTKFPLTTFSLHCCLPAVTTMRGGRRGPLGQENRDVTVAGSESKQHKTCLLEGGFLRWASCLLKALHLPYRGRDQEDFSWHHPSATCKSTPRSSGNLLISVWVSSQRSRGTSMRHFVMTWRCLSRKTESQMAVSPQNLI